MIEYKIIGHFKHYMPYKLITLNIKGDTDITNKMLHELMLDDFIIDNIEGRTIEG